MAARPLEGQLSFELFPKRTPGRCPDEGRVIAIGGGKSWCIPWDCYTNCREVGYCVYERWGRLGRR